MTDFTVATWTLEKTYTYQLSSCFEASKSELYYFLRNIGNSRCCFLAGGISPLPTSTGAKIEFRKQEYHPMQIKETDLAWR
jgi:hypothetical protein